LEKDDQKLHDNFNLGQKSLGVTQSDAMLPTKVQIDEHQSVLQQLVVYLASTLRARNSSSEIFSTDQTPHTVFSY
jgi:hypothetical protein